MGFIQTHLLSNLCTFYASVLSNVVYLILPSRVAEHSVIQNFHSCKSNLAHGAKIPLPKPFPLSN